MSPPQIPTEESTGQRLALALARAGMTQAELARRTNYSRSWVSQVVRGVLDPPVSVLAVLGRALSVEPATLVGHRTPIPADVSDEHPLIADVRLAMLGLSPVDAPMPTSELETTVGNLLEVWQSVSPHRMREVATAIPGLVRQLHAHDGQADSAHPVTMGWHLVRSVTKRLHGRELTPVAADRAIRTARNSDDVGLQAYASWNVGQAAAHAGHAEGALGIVLESIAETEPYIADGPRSLAAIFGNLHLSAAIYAGRMDDFDAATTYLEQASQIARLCGNGNAYRCAFGESNVGIHALTVWQEAGKLGRAKRAGERVDWESAPTVERRYTFLTQLAAVHAGQREDVGAVALFGQALQQSPEELALDPLARQWVARLLQRETSATRSTLRPIASHMGLIAA